MKRSPLLCHYCGIAGALARRVGEPPTCRAHADLPRLDDAELVAQQFELELDRELRLHDRGATRGAYRRE